MHATLIAVLFPVVVAAVGFLVTFAANPNVKELGRAAMWSGVLITTFVLAGKVAHL